MIKLDFNSVNDEISNILDNNRPASVLRIDNTNGYVMNCYSRNEEPNSQWFNDGTLIEAGVYPINREWYKENVVPRVEQSMMNSDLLGFVDISGDILNGDYLQKFQEFQTKKVFNSFLIMDPGALLGCSSQHKRLEKPWTSKLKNKKVLVISTHKESILSQWNKIDKIWGDNKDIIAPFELVDVIRSPYHPLTDNRQPPNCPTWLHSVDYVKELIDTYEYDVLLVGCSTSAPLYADHAKQNGKIGIQTGGVLQLYFGVTGYRWNQGEYKPWRQIYNDEWIYPLKVDEAQKREQLLHLETNFAYWST